MLTRPKSILPFQIAREAPVFACAVLRFVLDLRAIDHSCCSILKTRVSCSAWCISLRCACELLQRDRGFRDPAARRMVFYFWCALFAPLAMLPISVNSCSEEPFD